MVEERLTGQAGGEAGPDRSTVDGAVAALRRHWPEYLIEAGGLGLFMVSAGLFATLCGTRPRRSPRRCPTAWRAGD